MTSADAQPDPLAGADDPAASRILVWAERGQDDLIRDVLTSAGLSLAGIGAPESTTALELARGFETDRLDDLRQAILRDDAAVFWLASPDPLDADELRLLRQRPGLVITGEPRPMRLADALAAPTPPTSASSGPGQKNGQRPLHLAPRMRRAPGWRSAADALDDLAPARAVQILMTGAPNQTSLLARLFDALDVARHLLGPIRSIDATLASPFGSVPETLDRLHGHLVAHVRANSGRAATVCASDAAGVWQRRIDVLGESGWITIDDLGFDWRAVAPRRSNDSDDDSTSEPPAALAHERAEPPGRMIDANAADGPTSAGARSESNDADGAQSAAPAGFPTSLWDARAHKPTPRPDPIEVNQPPAESESAGAAITPGVLIGQEIRRLLDRRDNPAELAHPDLPEVLALCEAARLSCRTAQAETPAKLLQMMSARP